jgi:hypothetical protein
MTRRTEPRKQHDWPYGSAVSCAHSMSPLYAHTFTHQDTYRANVQAAYDLIWAVSARMLCAIIRIGPFSIVRKRIKTWSTHSRCRRHLRRYIKLVALMGHQTYSRPPTCTTHQNRRINRHTPYCHRTSVHQWRCRAYARASTTRTDLATCQPTHFTIQHITRSHTSAQRPACHGLHGHGCRRRVRVVQSGARPLFPRPIDANVR